MTTPAVPTLDPLRALVEQLEALPVVTKACPSDSHEIHHCGSIPCVSQTAVLLLARHHGTAHTDALARLRAERDALQDERDALKDIARIDDGITR